MLSAVAIELPQMVVGRSGSKKQWVGGKNGVGNLAWGQKWERGRRSVVSEIVAEIETETKLMLAWLGNVERRQRSLIFRNSRRKRNRNCGRNKKSWRDGNKTEVSFGGLGSSMEGLGGKNGSSRKDVVWETVRICFALLSPLNKDLTLTYHIFQGDVVVVVEAQYSEGTTHCQRWQSQWSLVTGAGPPQ